MLSTGDYRPKIGNFGIGILEGTGIEHPKKTRTSKRIITRSAILLFDLRINGFILT